MIKAFYGQKYFKNDYYDPLKSYNNKQNDYDQLLGNLHRIISDLNSAKEANNDDKIDSLNELLAKEADNWKQMFFKYKNVTFTAEEAAAKVAENLLSEKNSIDSAFERMESSNTLLWTLTTSLFVVGGMIGAFSSKFFLDFFGRKKGIIIHYAFSISGAILVFIAPIINSPECVMVSRFLYGIQGGLTCGLVPTYLAEISPSSLRGATGVLNQLFLTIGILIAQVLGFRQILGIFNKYFFDMKMLFILIKIKVLHKVGILYWLYQFFHPY